MKPLPKNLLHVTTRREWRAWLEAHYQSEPDVWLVYHRAASGTGRISYNDAVEEALCFGWIDSTARRIDDDRFAQRFSPRRRNSPYSQMNIERLRGLVARRRVKPAVRARLPDLSEDAFEYPEDIVRAIQANPHAWRNYERLPARYRRIRVAYIDGARKRPAEFEKRLQNFIRRTAKGERFGFGGIDAYFDDPPEDGRTRRKPPPGDR
jgi:uncharacterized protein YdeI (YjbR/CyaY-like superfamily)